MNRKMVVIFTLGLLVLCVARASGDLMDRYEKGYSITNFVEDADLVVYGEVVEKEFLLRQGVDYDAFESCTTDITIDVKAVIKGKPNADDGRVKFMFLGGACFDPETGEEYFINVGGEPNFEVEERVILFLIKSTAHQLGMRHIPHGGYSVFRSDDGKWLVKGARVPIWYTFETDVFKAIDLPVSLVVQIAKAAAKDPEATRRLEQEIKAHILHVENAFENLKARLNDEVKAIQEADPPSTTENKE